MMDIFGIPVYICVKRAILSVLNVKEKLIIAQAV